MNSFVDTDRILIASLPLPLAQAWRRTLYVGTPSAVHERAYFVLEASLKYLASVAVMSWVISKSDNAEARAACGALVRPSVGQWVRMLRSCRVCLPADQSPRRWIDAVIASPIDNRVAGLDGRTVGAILDDSLPAYRNSVSAHGSGLTATDLDERAPALMLVARQVLSSLAGDDAPVLLARAVECAMRLNGPTATIDSNNEQLVADSQLVLRFRDRLIPLSPLWIFDHDYDDVLVLSKGAGLEKVEYLSYGNPRGATGLVSFREQRAAAAKKLIEAVTGQATLRESEVESLINEAEVSELANRATGVRYGPFRVIRQISSGGQGILYEAVEENPPRRVALKTLPLQRALAASARRRMKEEAAALAQVEHPNVVPIYETGETDGIPWIAMKFVDGKSLDEILHQLRNRGGSVSLADFRSAASTSTGSPDEGPARTYTERIVSMIREAARALAACHQRGIIHRDIKPSNLMVDTSGRVVLTDFGLARTVDPRSQTFTQELVGTLQYLAPEALIPVGRSGPDGRVDVYGLGATLYESLALRRPFEEYEHDKAALLHAVQTKEAPPLRRVAPWVPREIEPVVMKAIERDRDRRYTTANEFADDLDRFLRGEPVRARPAGPVTLARKWVRRNPAKSAMGVAIIFLLAGLGLWRNAEQRRLAQAERQAGQVEQDISYLGGALRSTLGLNRPGNEAYLNAEVLRDARETISLMSQRVDKALGDPALNRTSFATKLESRQAEIEQQRQSMESLAEFYHQSDLAWFLTGAERDEEARVACQQAVDSIGALEDPEWWVSVEKKHPQLQKKQIDQLRQDVHRQLILLAAMRAKPAAVNFAESADKHILATREALNQADRFQHSAAGAIVDWFCRMRVGEKDLPAMPTPETATDHFLLGITHFWIAQFAKSPAAQMVLSSAPEHAGLDLKTPGESAIRHLRIACALDPQQYWHHFSLAWALGESGQKMLDAPPPDSERSKSGRGGLLNNALSTLTGGSNAAPMGVDAALAHLRDAELALNSCIALRPMFPRGYELRGRALVLQSLRQRNLEKAPANGTESSSGSNSTPIVSTDIEQLELRGMADFQRAGQLAPYDPDVYWATAHTMELLKRNREAVDSYRKAMQLDRPMGRMTGQQWVHMAESFLSEFVKAESGKQDAAAWGALALANFVLSQTDDQKSSTHYQEEAMSAVNKALSILSAEPNALAVRGSIRMRRGESREAIADFDAVILQESSNYQAAAGRAQSLEQLKEFAKALEAWKIVVDKCAVTEWQIREAQDAIQRLDNKAN